VTGTATARKLTMLTTIPLNSRHRSWQQTSPDWAIRILPKIRRMREMIERVKSDCDLDVDGGIDAATARLAVEAGADVLVAGTAVFGYREGVAAAMDSLRASLHPVSVRVRERSQVCNWE